MCARRRSRAPTRISGWASWRPTGRLPSSRPRSAPARRWWAARRAGASRCARAIQPSSWSRSPGSARRTCWWWVVAATRWCTGCCWGRWPTGCCTTPTGRCWWSADRPAGGGIGAGDRGRRGWLPGERGGRQARRSAGQRERCASDGGTRAQGPAGAGRVAAAHPGAARGLLRAGRGPGQVAGRGGAGTPWSVVVVVGGARRRSGGGDRAGRRRRGCGHGGGGLPGRVDGRAGATGVGVDPAGPSRRPARPGCPVTAAPTRLKGLVITSCLGPELPNLARDARWSLPAEVLVVRWAAVETTQRLPRGSKQATDFHRIADRRGTGIGRVAAARKLLTLVYYGLRDGQVRCLASAPAEAA